ncbi:MAG: DUF1622 domain-containing protein [Chloroflexota bacterium]|nr:DUF1622 domain-containing protein [Chloroflexota bacterium]
MTFEEWVELAGKTIDGAGIVIIIGGALLATLDFLNHLRRDEGMQAAYRRYRVGLGRAILLGLELLVAADIIRTVAIAPTFESVGVLAAIVLIRTFLSTALEVELEGRWPWRHLNEGGSDQPLTAKQASPDQNAPDERE